MRARIEVTRIIAPLVAVLAVAAALMGCGGGSESPACVVIDASKSTRFAIYDYLPRFRSEAEATAGAGGSIAAVAVTGEPLVEADVKVSEDFGELGNADQVSQLLNAVEEFTSGVERSARLASAGVTRPSEGSGIVAGIALASGQDCASVEVLSDGLEAADVRMKIEDIVSASGRDEILDRLEARDLLPDLEGIELRFPFGGYLPQGTSIPKARLDAVPKFWTDYADRTGAVLVWRR
ncbi:MAG TPA: hypothetical protein VJU14_13185 [Solirubrobacterales bacterium]|nr:hypothetical protein [Solirubrobacterales bacterium]